MQRTSIQRFMRALRRGVAAAPVLNIAVIRSGRPAVLAPAFVASVATTSITPSRAFAVTALHRSSSTQQRTLGGDVDDLEETHPDFQPRMVSTDLAEDEIAAIKKDIAETIRDEDIVVFIKGVPEAPMCAFSKKMVDVMEALGVEYTSFDVLAHPVVRSYVKEVSEWPTIPQVFIKGEFGGGVDIILKMAESGDLQLLLDEKGVKHRETK